MTKWSNYTLLGVFFHEEPNSDVILAFLVLASMSFCKKDMTRPDLGQLLGLVQIRPGLVLSWSQ